MIIHENIDKIIKQVQQLNNNGIVWTSRTKYVDIDTGEEITKHAASKMITIKTDKHVTTNWKKTRGYIEYTKQCRTNPQRELFTNKE